MQKVTIDAGSSGFRALADELGTGGIAINYYERAPGETIGYCYHRHREQEEVFYVISGAAMFETEEGDVRVGSGEGIRFAPGEWQQGRNAGAEPIRVLALGAPREQGPTDLMRDCPECGDRRPADVGSVDGAVVFTCADCGAETGRPD